jgi:hypothetical protein
MYTPPWGNKHDEYIEQFSQFKLESDSNDFNKKLLDKFYVASASQDIDNLIENDFIHDEFNVNSILELNVAFKSSKIIKFQDRYIQIFGELHSSEILSNEDKSYIEDDILKLIKIDPEVSLFEKNLQNSEIGSVFVNLMLKYQNIDLSEYDLREILGIFDLPNFNIPYSDETYLKYIFNKSLKHYNPIMYDKFYHEIIDFIEHDFLVNNTSDNHVSDDIIYKIQELNVFVYDIGILNRLVTDLMGKNVIIYCGEQHSTNIENLLYQYEIDESSIDFSKLNI